MLISSMDNAVNKTLVKHGFRRITIILNLVFDMIPNLYCRGSERQPALDQCYVMSKAVPSTRLPIIKFAYLEFIFRYLIKP